MAHKRRSVKGTRAWEAAEFEFSALYVETRTSMFGGAISADEINERLAEIIEICPKFYPAIVELAIRRLAEGAGRSEERRLLKGLELLLELAEPEDLEEQLEAALDSITRTLRYDVLKSSLRFLLERRPNEPYLHDQLAFALAQLGDVDAAIAEAEKAVQIEPGKAQFHCNLALYHLMAGNTKEARRELQVTREIDPETEYLSRNEKILAYITEHGGTYSDYLVRRLDRDELDRLAESDKEADQRRLERLCEEYNKDRMVAFALATLSDPNKRREWPDRILTLCSFFKFVKRIANTSDFLEEDIWFMSVEFNSIMHKFIFKHRDADRPLLEATFQTLVEYYGFLARAGLVDPDEYDNFRKMVRSRAKTLIQKASRYNEVRQDPKLTEEEKEAIREELFEGDHFWPFL